MRPIGLVFSSWKLNLASFGLEMVQAPPSGHPATQHEKHLHGMNVAVGRQPVSGVVDFEQQGGAAAVVGRITDQGEARQAWSCSGRSSWGRSGIGVRTGKERLHGAGPGRSRQRLGDGDGDGGVNTAGPTPGAWITMNCRARG